MNDGGPGTDGAVATDGDGRPDHCARPDQRTGADLGLRSDHRQRIDGNARFQPGGRMNARIGRAAGRLEQGRRSQRRRKECARHHNKGPIGLGRDQHRKPLGRLRGKARRRQASTGTRRRERREILRIVEKRDVGRARAIKRGDIADRPLKRRVRSRLGAGQADDVSDRQLTMGREKSGIALVRSAWSGVSRFRKFA